MLKPLKPPLKIFLCAPRGFCAGVVRAIDIVEKALQTYGPPVYVRHEIVHNAYVVERLRAQGAIFVDELEEIPDTHAPVIFSAHGVPKSVPEEAKRRLFFSIDATCPLVTKIHREALIHWKRGKKILLIGHKGHPEVIGTMGQLPEGAVVLIETLEDIHLLQERDIDPNAVAYVTQTTLSVEDTRDLIQELEKKYPKITPPYKEDICYATTNRQSAVKQLAPLVDAMIIVGSPNSSNSQRLREVALKAGCPLSDLILRAGDIDWSRYKALARLGITAGASAPEILVEEMVSAFSERYRVEVEPFRIAEEDIFFPLPKSLRAR